MLYRSFINSTLVFISLLFSSILYSQERCGIKAGKNKFYKDTNFVKTVNRLLLLQKQSKVSNDSLVQIEANTIIKIPVVVHVFHNNKEIGSGSNITDETILSQISALNLDYRKQNSDISNSLDEYRNIAGDAKIEFCLASTDPNCNPTNGIVRINTPKASVDVDNDYNTIKKLSYWPSDKYLNIWVAELTGGYLGISVFPYVNSMEGLSDSYVYQDFQNSIYDGVLINYKAFGTTGSHLSKYYNKGRTTTHEVGHWLGLLHIFNDDSFGCGNDYCDDTPPQQDATSQCERKNSCDGTHLTMRENFLDYSVDECMSMFTLDQISRMRNVFNLNSRRNNIFKNNFCQVSPNRVFNESSETFENDTIANYLNVTEKAWVKTNKGAYDMSNFCLKNELSKENNILLTTNKIDFSSVKYNYLTFDIALKSASSSLSSVVFSLEYSYECADNWRQIKTFTINQINLSNKEIKSDSWTSNSVDISSIAPKYVKFRIRVLNYSETSPLEVYIDNINFQNNINDQLELFYNQENNSLNFKTNYIGSHDFEYMIYDLNGKLLLTQSLKNITSQSVSLKNIVQINEMYLVKLVSNYKTYTLKFVCTQ